MLLVSLTFEDGSPPTFSYFYAFDFASWIRVMYMHNIDGIIEPEWINVAYFFMLNCLIPDILNLFTVIPLFVGTEVFTVLMLVESKINPSFSVSMLRVKKAHSQTQFLLTIFLCWHSLGSDC